MRIAILNSFYFPTEPGGAERSCRSLAEALAKNGHDVHILCTDSWSQIDNVQGVTVHRFKIANLFWPGNTKQHSRSANGLWALIDNFNLVMAAKVAITLSRLKPDVLHTNNISGFGPFVWLAARLCRVPIVHTLRDYYLLCRRSTMFTGAGQCQGQCMQCKFFSAPKKISSFNVDRIVGNSRFILNKHLKSGYFKPQAENFVIFNAARFGTEVTARPAPNDVLTLGYIGRLSREKGIEVACEAVAMLRGRGAAVKLLIAGTGDPAYVEELKAQFKDVAHFMGHMTQKDFYSRIDIALVPSLWHEPLARVIFESFHFGVPVIANDTGGSSEAIRSGVNGWLYTSTPEELAEAILLAHSNYSILSAGALASKEQFSEKALLSRYMAVYKSVR